MRRASSRTSHVEALVSSFPDMVLLVDAGGRCTWANGEGKDFFGDHVVGSEPFQKLQGEDGVRTDLQALLEGRSETLHFESWHRRADGRERLLAWRCRRLVDHKTRSEAVFCARDVTERAETEKKVLQSQRLEALGRLAGGVAHDFNNVLTTISCYCALMKERAESDEGTLQDLREIEKAAERAGHLTSQLLAFSRRQVVEPVPLSLNDVIAGLTKLLRGSLGEDIELITHLEPDLSWVEADPAQIDEVLLNLATNARDAMPSGGQLIIETANVEVDEGEAARRPPMEPGRYVRLLVKDTGTGMDDEVRSRLFEPFYTTKPAGSGTGLGLASVYGIVKQNGGFIWVSSTPGQGSTFTIYLPPAAEGPSSVRPPSRKTPLGQPFTVLLVEDDDLVRRVTADILAKKGYTVLATKSGEEALEVSERHGGPIHLLLTDVVLPKMHGPELAERLQGSREQMRPLFMTGYADEALSGRGILQGLSPLLKKPFTPESLLRKVQEALGA